MRRLWELISKKGRYPGILLGTMAVLFVLSGQVQPAGR